MSRLERNEIPWMRHEGMSYAQIAAVLGLSVNTVKSYCQRDGLGGVAVTGAGSGVCAHCGKPVRQTDRWPQEEAVLLGRMPHGVVEGAPGAAQQKSRVQARLRGLRKAL
jgi:uncharacterized protein YjcR